MKYRRFLQFATPYRRSLVALAFLTIADSMVLLTIPFLAGTTIGSLVSQDGETGQLIWLLVAALVAITSIRVATMAMSATTSAEILADLRTSIHHHLQRLPLSFHENQRQGDILAITTYEIWRLANFLTGTLAVLPSRALVAAGAILAMARIDWKLALVVPILIPLFFLILKIIGRRLRGIAIRLQQAEADLVATIEEDLEMLPAIKSFAREEATDSRYEKRVRTATRMTIQQGRINAIVEPVTGLVAAIGAVAIFSLAGETVRTGSMSPSDFFSFLLYAALLTRPVGTLANLYGQTQTVRGALSRLDDILGLEPEAGYESSSVSTIGRDDISFRDVAFSYPGREFTLSCVTFDVKGGETIALVGDNGAGKTTLVNLLLRFRDPDTGSILLGGQDIVTLQVQELRRRIGLVPQRTLLFNASIRENIGFGSDGATDAEIEHACELAQASAFISALPEGLNTVIGDHGVRLSGGQRQRIALARALVGDPPVLILDEATSMYDNESEEAFIHVCADAFEHRTVILIAHRPASLAMADRIFEVGNSTVREIKPEERERAFGGDGSGA